MESAPVKRILEHTESTRAEFFLFFFFVLFFLFSEEGPGRLTRRERACCVSMWMYIWRRYMTDGSSTQPHSYKRHCRWMIPPFQQYVYNAMIPYYFGDKFSHAFFLHLPLLTSRHALVVFLLGWAPRGETAHLDSSSFSLKTSTSPSPPPAPGRRDIRTHFFPSPLWGPSKSTSPPTGGGT